MLYSQSHVREYDLIADWYWTDRGRTVGVTEALVTADYRVIGLDSSIGMLAHFRDNLPGTLPCAATPASVRSSKAALTPQFPGE